MRYYLLGTICVAAAVGISYDFHRFTVDAVKDEMQAAEAQYSESLAEMEEERQTLLDHLFNAGVARSELIEDRNELAEALSRMRDEFEAAGHKAAAETERADNLANQLALANQAIDALIPEPVVNPDPMDATMKLLIEGGGHGSATHIGNGFVITAGHVARNEGEILTARFKNGDEFEAVTLWSNRAHDVALLRIEEWEDIPASHLQCRTPHMGESVGLYGNPMALEFIGTTGKVAGDVTGAYDSAWAEALPIDGAMGPGMSGGGAFDDDGNLVGINVGIPLAVMGLYNTTFTGISFIVPSSTICNLMGRTE